MITYGLKQHYFERWPPRREHPARFMTPASSCGEKLGGASLCGHQLGRRVTLEEDGRVLLAVNLMFKAEVDGARRTRKGGERTRLG